MEDDTNMFVLLRDLEDGTSVWLKDIRYGGGMTVIQATLMEMGKLVKPLPLRY